MRLNGLSLLLSLTSFWLLSALILAGLAAYSAWMFMIPGPLPQGKLVVIERGWGVSHIATALEQESVISSALLFKAAERINGPSVPLKAGEYAFTPRIPMSEVLLKLRAGRVFERKFTVAEGLTSYQIVTRLRGINKLDGEIAAIPAEGTLLPETYHYVRGDSRAGKITQMQATMRELMAQLWPQRAENLPYENQQDALTLSSIIEKETGIGGERRRIAGVFINRLRKNMPLQSDPTVIYALTGGKIEENGMGPLGRRLLRKDLQETDSPYNTYKYAGLPPGPIANPGREALEAALQPEEHDYYYFVADGSGGHVFARTLDEHNRNVAQWRKIRRSREP